MPNRGNKIKLNFSANGVSEDEWSFLIWVLVCKIIKMGKPSHSSIFAKGIDCIQISIRLHQSNGHSDALCLIQVNVLNLSVGKILISYEVMFSICFYCLWVA